LQQISISRTGDGVAEEQGVADVVEELVYLMGGVQTVFLEDEEQGVRTRNEGVVVLGDYFEEFQTVGGENHVVGVDDDTDEVGKVIEQVEWQCGDRFVGFVKGVIFLEEDY
jgi:hypothetical protein